MQRIISSPWILLLLLIITLGFLVRLYKIDSPVADWHSWRQADTASVSRIYVERGIDLLHPRYHDFSQLQSGIFNPEGWRFVEFPVYNALHAVLAENFAVFSLEKWGRLLSVIFSTFSTILIFLLGKRFLGTSGGILGAFFFAFLPYNIYFSRVILPEPASVAFALLAIYLFSLWHDVRMTRFALFAGLSFSLALLIKPYTIFYGIPMLWLALKRFDGNLGKVLLSKDLWLFSIISLFPVGLWRLWMAQFPEGIPYYKWAFNFMGIRFRPAFWRWIFGERLADLILGVWGLFPFVIGLLKRSAKDDWFSHFFIFGMFLYVALVAAGNVRHDYYQTLTIPAVSLVLARGTNYLWRSREFVQPFTRLVLVFAVLLGFYMSWNDIKQFYQINHPEIIRAGEALDRIAPKDALVVAPYNGDTAFLYQTKRSGWPIQEIPIEELVKQGADYYVSVNKGYQGTFDAVKKFEVAVEEDDFVIIDLNKKRM